MNSHVYCYLSPQQFKLIKALYFSITCLAILNISQRGTTQTSYATPYTQQYDEFWQQNSADFQQWSLNGVAVQSASQPINVQLTPSSRASCSSSAIDGGTVKYDSALAFCTGKDPYNPKSYNHGQDYYNGGSFYFGTLTSPQHATRQPITTLLASWNADTPAGTWLEIHIRVMEGDSWTHWYKLPIWASDSSTIKRHSINEQNDVMGSIQTDTFVTAARTASAYQLNVTLFSQTPVISPHLTRLSVIASYDTNADTTPDIHPDKTTWGLNLLVPQRSQMLAAYRGLDFGGGPAWCSPTSTSMVLAYWSSILKQSDLQQSVPDAAKSSYDYTYHGTGNWPFNTAYAGSFGLKAFVTKMYSLSQIEAWIKMGVPIIISVAYQPGELSNSPIPASDGHLLVVRGFTAHGDVITNDPAAASNAAVQIIYQRKNLQTIWLNASQGTVYVIYPENWQTPAIDQYSTW